MKEMYVNLKRYEVSEKYGGICPVDEPKQWIREVVHDTVRMGLGRQDEFSLTIFLPESLLALGLEALAEEKPEDTGSLRLGCEGVFRDDIQPGENFGRFTANCPASALKALDCDWVLVGHSEERRDLVSLLDLYAECCGGTLDTRAAGDVSDMTMNRQLLSALNRGMSVLFCVGESSEQKGSDDPRIYKPRVKEVLHRQLELGLAGAAEVLERQNLPGQRLSIAYEPIWAVGPGKTPASADYVSFVSRYIKDTCAELFGREYAVIYGGGLTGRVAEEIAGVDTVDGGFVGLTRFTKPYEFDTAEMKKIIMAYIKGAGLHEKN